MSSSLSFHIPKALPSLSPLPCRKPSLSIFSHQKQSPNSKPNKKLTSISQKNPNDIFNSIKPSLAVQVGALLTTVAQPALAVTGVNNEEDFTWVLIQLGISAFLYFLVAPPIIMNWLRIRWYRRNLVEMYFQFMFVFMFFPGVLLWAPFLNFRKFPRDPSMKYPWSVPEVLEYVNRPTSLLQHHPQPHSLQPPTAPLTVSTSSCSFHPLPQLV